MKFPKLKNKFILAPMADITNVAFRMLCKKLGASYCVTEMVSADGVINNSQSTLRYIDTVKEEKPVGLQLFGNDLVKIKKAAEKIKNSCDVIDLNLGCSVPKIFNQGSGSFLLKQPEKIKEILSELTKIKKPVTCKIRSGITKKKINAVKIAKIAEETNCAAIAVHARTADQGYTGKADWKIIKKVKENVSIPVFGNGDVCSPKDAEKLLENCDYVMVGREAMKNPFIFKQCVHYFKTGELLPDLNAKQKIDLLYDYFNLMKKYNITSMNIRKIAAHHFTIGCKGSTKLRQKLSLTKTETELRKVLDDYTKFI